MENSLDNSTHLVHSAERDGLDNCTQLISTIIPRKSETLTKKQDRKKAQISLSCQSLLLYPSPINCHLWGNTQAIVNYNATVLRLPLKEFGR